MKFAKHRLDDESLSSDSSQETDLEMVASGHCCKEVRSEEKTRV